MRDFIGKIAKGYKADLVLLDLDHVQKENLLAWHVPGGRLTARNVYSR